jgi:hypothetical protein
MTVTPLEPSAHRAQPSPPPGAWHGNLWVAAAPQVEAGSYREFVADHGRSGRWPVVIPHDPRFHDKGEDWPADRGGLVPVPERIAGVDVEQVLRRWWTPPCCDGNCLKPFTGGFPGLARAVGRRADSLAEAGNTGSILAMRYRSRLGLVHTERPADIPALIGWTGTVGTTDDVAAVSAVLRSWEERFGAVVIGIGYDTLELSVAAPPKSARRALAVAAEHRAFCPRSFTDQPGTMREFAAGLQGKRLWKFTWR